MRLKLIGCEVILRELSFVLARSPHTIDAEFLPKGLHDLGGAKMRDRLQEVVDATDPQRYEAILLGYALCGNGALGLRARAIPLVIPRAHDCIALLMGSRQRYQEYFDANPGVYFRSTGWLERGRGLDQTMLHQTRSLTGAGYALQELIDKYGEENGRYLFEQLHTYHNHYQQLTYIETGLEPDGRFEEDARREAEEHGWRFTKIVGDFQLFERLVDGDWDPEHFLVVPPGHAIGVSYDDQIVRLEEIQE
jgi:hypothetical protein